MTIGEQCDEELIDAFAVTSRALVAVAARSLAGLSGGEVTLPQYRALVILATQGPQRVIALAERLDVNSSTASRMVDRLVRKKLVHRRRDESDRRAMTIDLTPEGRQLVDEATRRRRNEIARILDEMPLGSRKPLIEAMVTFARAAGEAPNSSLHSLPSRSA
jgi:DNA-binding MarR family transcriptional regulator